MKLAIIGAGNVGNALGNRLLAAGHAVNYGVKNPDDPKHAGLAPHISTITAAVAGADIILLATPWAGMQDTLKTLGNLDGKILVDCTNPIKADFSGLEVGHTNSGAEMIATWAPSAKIVKCFNQTGFANMQAPAFAGHKSVMFAAGDDPEAVAQVARLASDIGFEAVALKGLSMSRQLEQLAWLWIDMAMKQGKGRDFAFGLLHR